MHLKASIFPKFSGGACPQIPIGRAAYTATAYGGGVAFTHKLGNPLFQTLDLPLLYTSLQQHPLTHLYILNPPTSHTNLLLTTPTNHTHRFHPLSTICLPYFSHPYFELKYGRQLWRVGGIYGCGLWVLLA